MTNRFQISKNFWLNEFQCKCCSVVRLEPELVGKLQALRDELKVPLTINSGYRCPKHNRLVGGVEDSFHTQGKASDILVEGKDREFVERLCSVAKRLDFKGIGRYKSKETGKVVFIHLDIGTERFRSWEKEVQ